MSVVATPTTSPLDGQVAASIPIPSRGDGLELAGLLGH